MIWIWFKNEDRIPKKRSENELNGKCPRGRSRLQWEQQATKDSIQKERIK
jgi:hypothetical protein